MVCFGGLAALARKYSPLTPLRWFSLVTSCLVGAFGAVMVALPPDGPPKMIGLLLAFVGMAGVWLTVEQRAQRLQSE